jgi:hypothetical protein
MFLAPGSAPCLGRGMDPSPGRGVWVRWLVAHAVVVVVCTVLFGLIVFATPPEAGFNFGVVYVGLPLLALGLPWNMATFIDPYQFDGLSLVLRSLVEFGPAFLNLAIHGALFWIVSRRRERGAGSAARLPQG